MAESHPGLMAVLLWWVEAGSVTGCVWAGVSMRT